MINYIFAPTHLSRFDALAIALIAYAYGTGKIDGWMYIVGLLTAVTLSVLVQEAIK